MTAAAEFCGLACGTHARNMHRNIAPYSYGLAARARCIYNDVACSGGQGVRPSRQTLPLEATRPGLLGTPGLVYSSSQRPSGFSPFAPLHRHNHIGNAPRGMRSLGLRAGDQSDPRNCQMISSATITGMPWMMLRTIPLIALSAFRGGRRCRHLVARASAMGPSVRRRGSGFQIHLNFVFCSDGRISVC
jgi:hypothetical protein